MSFVMAEQEIITAPSGAIEGVNISIACEGAIRNSPKMFQSFLLFPSLVAVGSHKLQKEIQIVSSDLKQKRDRINCI